MGAQYFINEKFSVIAEYRLLTSKVTGSSDFLAKSVDLTMLNVGAGFHF